MIRAMTDDRPPRWEQPSSPQPTYGVVRRDGMTDEDVERIARRREREAAADRLEAVLGVSGPTVVRDEPWSALCVVAFVLALLLPPVGLALGVAGLVTVDGDRYRGHGLAVAAVVIGALFSIVGLLLV